MERTELLSVTDDADHSSGLLNGISVWNDHEDGRESHGGGGPLAADPTRENLNVSAMGKFTSMYYSLRHSWFVEETIMLVRLAIPMLLLNLFQQLPFLIVLLFVGHFSGTTELNATALSSTFVNVTGFSVIVGIATAADTLCPQSYGFKNYKRVGVVLQKGILIISIICIPVIILWLNSGSILLLLKQLPCVVRLAREFIIIYIVAIPALVLYVMLQKYLQAQSLVWVFVGIGVMMNVSVLVFGGLFIVLAKWGVRGASLSLATSTWLAPLLLLLYMKYRNLHRQTWGGWSFESLTEWCQFLRYGFPGFLMIAFEWWSFEISTLVTGSISETQLSINTILLQVGILSFMIPLGIGTAANIRVGNELGAGNVLSAKRASYVALTLQSIIAVLLTLTIFTCKSFIGRIFTSKEDVIDGVRDTLSISAILYFFDQIQGLISGIIRATGRQAIAAVANFVCYYIIGVPLGVILAIKVGLKTKGMWIGLTVAIGLQCISLFIILLTTNWKKRSEQAMKNASSGSGYPVSEHTSSESISTEEDSMSSNSPKIGTGIELKEIATNEVEGLSTKEDKPDANLVEDNPLESYEDTEKLMSQDTEKLLSQDTEKLMSQDTEKLMSQDTEKLLSQDTEKLMSQDTEKLMSQDMEKLMSQDTEKLLSQDTKKPMSQDTASQIIYSSSCKCCQSKLSNIICKSVILLVGVSFLIVGGVLSVTIRHPVDCDETMSASNCSIVCQSSFQPSKGTPLSATPNSISATSSLLTATPSPSDQYRGRSGDNYPSHSLMVMPTPTSTYSLPERGVALTPVVSIMPSYSFDELGSGDMGLCWCEVTPTPLVAL